MKVPEMPILKPIPIRTKGVPYWKALWRWLVTIRKWQLVADWHHELPDGKTVVIPAGFEFDGASIPRTFRWLLSPVGLLLIPGLIHDYAYLHDRLQVRDAAAGLVAYSPNAGRAHWDWLFRQVAIQVNGFTVINTLAWGALRIAGWVAWGKRRRMAAGEPI